MSGVLRSGALMIRDGAQIWLVAADTIEDLAQLADRLTHIAADLEGSLRAEFSDPNGVNRVVSRLRSEIRDFKWALAEAASAAARRRDEDDLAERREAPTSPDLEVVPPSEGVMRPGK
jgi:hypothetical protein